MNRFTHAQVEAWRKDGFAVIPQFFSQQELAPLRLDYERMYGTSGNGAGATEDEESGETLGVFGEFRTGQFRNIDTLPFSGCSVEMNLISLHPALIEFAMALLGVERVHLYQSHTWAKFTGEVDYEQDFHCDFGNHTLLAPSDTPQQRSVAFVIYLTEVTDQHGPFHYVTKTDSDEILGKGRVGAADLEKQQALKSRERSAVGPAGTLVAHGIDTFHRGTNLTLSGGYRYTVTIGYKAAGNDMIGFHVWQQAEDRDWSVVLNHASPEQLSCLGIPEPGDKYWTMRTLKLTQARWPEWDMSAYFAAAG